MTEFLTHCSVAAHTWGQWTVANLSQQGLRHHGKGDPSDDAYLVQPVGDHLLLAIADGVSQCPMSRHGAQLAMVALLSHVDGKLRKGPPHKDILAHAMANTHYALASEARRTGHDILDYSCTLAVALLGPTTLYAASLGDSSITQLTKLQASPDPDAHTLLPLCGSHQCDPNGAVWSITLQNWADYLQTTSQPIDAVDAVILNTDGCDHFIINEGRPPGTSPFSPSAVVNLRKALAANHPRQLPIWLAGYMQKLEGNNFDDRTLVIATRDTPS